MPARLSRIVVVSDLHMAPPGPLDSFHAGDELADWAIALGSAEVPASETLLVMNGDTFDFLQVEERPDVLDAVTIAELIEHVLGAIKDTPWGKRLYQALAGFTGQGGQWLVIPGNHDPELYHPRAADLLARATGADPARVIVHADAVPWRTVLGDREIVIGHGNRSDPWNDIDPVAWRAALDTGHSPPALPPGSRLVLDTINAFKGAGYRFVDVLKPEMPGVLLLLLYLDRKLALGHMPGVAGNAAAAIMRAVRKSINRGPALAHGVRGSWATGPAPAEVNDLLAGVLIASLTDAERAAPDMFLHALEGWLKRGDSGTVRAGSLAAHGGIARWMLREALRLLSYDGTFFDPHALSAVDRAIIEDALPAGGGRRVVVAGHTHAARYHVFPDGRVYINTGTWTDLMRLPDAEAELAGWIDSLEAGQIEHKRTLNFADITAQDARLLGMGTRAESAHGSTQSP